MTMHATFLRLMADHLDRTYNGETPPFAGGPPAAELVAALRAGAMALLGTHPGIALRVRFRGLTTDPAHETIYEANSDAIHVQAELWETELGDAERDTGPHSDPYGAGRWLQIIEPIRDVNGFPFLHVEARPVDLVTHPEELQRFAAADRRLYQDIGDLRAAMAARS